MELSGATRGESKARTRLGWLLGARLLLAGLSLGLAVVIDRVDTAHGTPGIWGVYWTIVAAFMATIVSAQMVSRTKDPARFAMLQVGIDLTIVTSLVYFSGGGESFFTFLYALVVLYGAIFLDRGGVAVSCGLAAAGYAFVLFGSELGLPPSAGTNEASRPVHLLAAYWGFYAGALLVLGMLANTLTAELRRTGAALDRQTSDLRRLRDLHLQTVASIGSGLLTSDEAGNVTSFNPGAERITGLRADEAEGHPLNELIPGASGVIESGEGHVGEEESAERNRLAYQSMRGEDLHLGLASSSLRDEDGRQIGHVVIFQDVSRVVSMEQDLRQSERLAAVGEMAARMAHEIRNPLASISGSVQILQNAPQKSSNEKENGRLMGIVVREVDRLNVLISDFLRYSRPAPMKPERVNLSAMLGEIAEISASRAKPDGCPPFSVTLEVEPDISVMADPAQLTAVIWNLWNNATEAMASQDRPGVLFARVRRLATNAAQAQNGLDRKEVGERWGGVTRDPWTAVLEIEDSGPGIPPDVQEMIFEPFFTTKQDGTGLGLATVQRLVEQHGGAIQVSSRPGQGTCFRVSLQCAEEA